MCVGEKTLECYAFRLTAAVGIEISVVWVRRYVSDFAARENIGFMRIDSFEEMSRELELIIL